MSKQEKSSASTDENRHGPGRRNRHGFLSGIVLGSVAGAILALSVGAFAQFGGHRGARDGALDSDFIIDRSEFAVEMLLGRIDATDAQQTQVKSIVEGVIGDLQIVMSEHGSTHETIREILAQPYVDRVALEQLRADALLQADTTSQRVMQALADAAEVLTPEQRVELMEVGQRFRR